MPWGRRVRAEANPRAGSYPLGRGFEALCLQMSFRRKGYTNATPDPSLERKKVEKKMRKEEKKRRTMGENRTGK